jgi:50S ribosomal subunit-associated GTPase HflX
VDPRWDTPFNRAINVIKGRAMSLPPTLAGCVAGYGTYNKVGNFKKEDREAKKERKATAAVVAATASERREVEKLREQMPDLIAEQVQQKLREIIPDELWEGLAAWNAAGR